MSGKKPCPAIYVRPCRTIVDEKFAVLVQQLPPGQAVTIHALLHSEDGDFWEAFGHYTPDDRGVVDVTKDASTGGSYDGVEPMGLLWSMKPVPGSRPGLRLRKKDVHTPLVVHISVYQGHLHEGFKEAKALACGVAERWYMAPGVQRVSVSENGIRGMLFLPPGPGPFPALLDLWGGGGGLVEYRSAMLASHGYVSLALDYMTPKISGTTVEHVGNDYFEAAYRLLQNHPQVCGDRIAMMGLSFGTSVALGMAVYSPVIKPKCLVCVSGSHIMPVNGSLSDVFKAIEKNVRNTRYDEENRVIWRDLLLPIPDDPSKKVDVGRLQCPVLLLVGEDDQNWPASESAEDIDYVLDTWPLSPISLRRYSIKRRNQSASLATFIVGAMKQMMEKAGNSHLLSVASYPMTGHLIEPPYSPHFRSSNFMVAQSRTKVVVLWGGQTVAHCKAQEDAWHKTLAFLEDHLYGNTHK